MKTRIRFAKGNPNDYTTDSFYDILVEPFVVYPRIMVGNKFFQVVETVSLPQDPEADKMLIVLEGGWTREGDSLNSPLK